MWLFESLFTFRQIFGKGLHVICCMLTGRVSTQMSPHRLHLLLQGCLRILLCSLMEQTEIRLGEAKEHVVHQARFLTSVHEVYLKSHVLQKKASSVVLLALIATASADPQSNL